MKHVTPIDNPINGYVEGHADSEDLGIFVLSPRCLNIKNHPPETKEIRFWFITENRFDEGDEDFYDPSK